MSVWDTARSTLNCGWKMGTERPPICEEACGWQQRFGLRVEEAAPAADLEGDTASKGACYTEG